MTPIRVRAAAEIVHAEGCGRATDLQRKLRVNFTEATRILSALEQAGVLEPKNEEGIHPLAAEVTDTTEPEKDGKPKPKRYHRRGQPVEKSEGSEGEQEAA